MIPKTTVSAAIAPDWSHAPTTGLPGIASTREPAVMMDPLGVAAGRSLTDDCAVRWNDPGVAGECGHCDREARHTLAECRAARRAWNEAHDFQGPAANAECWGLPLPGETAAINALAASPPSKTPSADAIRAAGPYPTYPAPWTRVPSAIEAIVGVAQAYERDTGERLVELRVSARMFGRLFGEMAKTHLDERHVESFRLSTGRGADEIEVNGTRVRVDRRNPWEASFRPSLFPRQPTRDTLGDVHDLAQELLNERIEAEAFRCAEVAEIVRPWPEKVARVARVLCAEARFRADNEACYAMAKRIVARR